MTTESTTSPAAQVEEGEKTTTPNTTQTTESNSSVAAGDNTGKGTPADGASGKLKENNSKACLPDSIPKKPTSSEMYSASHYD
ncbi:hypothetical protein QBC41DRAFT_320802 [Cercophora samala]|uniref:Uncharacterized protein n=1 Tax=Cercophora samala TaxID=330535 RepID=A0AA39ZDC9_9PEZI|nr:hypothetical protein QBC41DRAFT_320802 [Cercophora samala]